MNLRRQSYRYSERPGAAQQPPLAPRVPVDQGRAVFDPPARRRALGASAVHPRRLGGNRRFAGTGAAWGAPEPPHLRTQRVDRNPARGPRSCCEPEAEPSASVNPGVAEYRGGNMGGFNAAAQQSYGTGNINTQLGGGHNGGNPMGVPHVPADQDSRDSGNVQEVRDFARDLRVYFSHRYHFC